MRASPSRRPTRLASATSATLTTMKTLPALASLVLVTSPPAAAQQRSPGASAFPPDSAVLAILKERVEQGRSTGLVVGMLEPDGRRRIVAWGDPGPDAPPLDGESVFEIGSITKVFTATVLADMVQKGQVSLDDPVQRYLPEGVTVPSRSGKVITLGMLAEQNSGLPRLPGNLSPPSMADPYADYAADDLYAFLSSYALPRDPGAEYEYSNLAVGLLGHVLSLVADTSYEAMVDARVLKPLGMTHTGITVTPWMREHRTVGHDERGDTVPDWHFQALAGAGALRSTARDMLTFLEANLHPERGDLQRAMAFAHRERAPAGGPTQTIGLNWIRTVAGDDTLVWHNGGTAGYRSFAGMIPSKGTGVVVLTNTGGTGADDIGIHLLHPAAPLAPAPEARRELTAIELPADQLARYVGTYRMTPEFELTVTLEDGGLFVQATGQGKLRLWPFTKTDFFVKEVEAQVSFQPSADGTVTGLVLHQGGRDSPARKIR